MGSSPASVVRFQKNKEKKETRSSSRPGFRAPPSLTRLPPPGTPRAVAAPRAAIAASLAAAGDSARRGHGTSRRRGPRFTSRRHRSARRRHVRLLALPPQLRVPRRPGAAAAQSQARSSKRCRGASRCCRHLLEAPSNIVSLLSAGRAEKSLSPKYFSYRKCCLLDNYPCSSV